MVVDCVASRRRRRRFEGLKNRIARKLGAHERLLKMSERCTAIISLVGVVGKVTQRKHEEKNTALMCFNRGLSGILYG